MGEGRLCRFALQAVVGEGVWFCLSRLCDSPSSKHTREGTVGSAVATFFTRGRGGVVSWLAKHTVLEVSGLQAWTVTR